MDDDYLRHLVKNIFVPMEIGEPEQEEEDSELALDTRTMIQDYDTALRDSVAAVSTMAILCMHVPQQLSRSVASDTRCQVQDQASLF